MLRLFERVLTPLLLLSRFASYAAAEDTQWYQPQQVDGALKPAAEDPNTGKKRPPYILSGELNFTGSYESSDGATDISETDLVVRLEQQWAAFFVGVASIGDGTAFEAGGEFNTGGIVLTEFPDGKLSLLTPAIGGRLVTKTDTTPGLKGLVIKPVGLRYCRCASAKPLVIDFHGPVYNRVFGESEMTDMLGNTTTVSVDAGAWGASFSVGMGF